MAYKLSCFIFLLFAISCASKKHEVEYLEYYYNGSPILRKDDKILIKYIPNKKDVKVELNYHGKNYSRKPINKKEYQKILTMFFKIKNDDINLINDISIKGENKITSMDAGASEIMYLKDNSLIKHLVFDNKKEGNEIFYNTTVLIFKNAGLETKYIK